MNVRRASLLFVSAAIYATATATAASADDRPVTRDARPDETTDAPRWSFPATVGVQWMKTEAAYQPLRGMWMLGLGASYRIDPRWSVGGVSSYARTSGGDVLWQAAAEGRYHVARTRALDLWGAGLAGFGFHKSFVTSFAAESDAGAGSSSVGNSSATRIAPLVGIATGLDVFPVPALSLGLEGRASMLVFGDAGGRSESPAFATPVFSFGLSLGIHLPDRGVDQRSASARSIRPARAKNFAMTRR